MLTKTKAIVLHSFKYGEAQMITELLTETGGRVSCIVKIPKRAGSGVRRQYFLPLTVLDTVMDIRRQSRLQKICEARIDGPLPGVRINPRKAAIALFMAELLRAVTRMELTDGVLFAYTENSIRWLDGCEGHFANFHLVFMMRLTKFLGFYPNTEGGEPGEYFDLATGCFCPAAPLHPHFLPPHEAAKIGLLLRMNFPTMHLYKMSHAERNRMVEVIMSYYRLHIPGMPELKSLPVLRELFA